MNWSPLIVSVKATALATIAAVVIGLAVGYVLAKVKLRGTSVVEGLLTIPMVLPPTVTGFYLLTTMRIPWLEETWIKLFHSPLAFTFPAIVIAATVESLPYCLRASRAAIASVESRMEQAARCLGLPEGKVGLRITLPLAANGIASGAALGLARALGDFGATLFVGGSFHGRTLTLPIAVFDSATAGDFAPAYRYSLVLFVVALCLLAIVHRLGSSRI